MGLATKITLPFVALFALLLLALGIVLAREILAEAEARVENEQSFVLDVATFPGFALGEDALRQIRDRAAPAAEPGVPAVHGEFIVLQEDGTAISTFSHADGNARSNIDALEQALRTHPSLALRDESIRRELIELNGLRWLVLHTSRATRGPAPLRRHYFLLYPYFEIERAKNHALLRIIALGGLGLLLASILGLAMGRWISGPVRRLAAAAKRLSAGGLDEPLEPGLQNMHGTDEISELTRSFQSMVENLRRTQSELLKAERLATTGKLAAGVAHEIRNPLTSLRMTVEMLQRRSLSTSRSSGPDAPLDNESYKDEQEAYKILLNEIDRLALAVEELLTFARPRPPQREPTDLNELATQTLKFLERQLAHAKVRGVLELDPALPRDIPLDPNKMRQVLVNLILNAQQAIVRDGEISVQTQWNALENHALLSVRDTGPGVAEEIRNKLFDLFVSTKAGGGGLGLAVARQIAEEHGGRISYETTPHGATFTVLIPGRIVDREGITR